MITQEQQDKGSSTMIELRITKQRSMSNVSRCRKRSLFVMTLMKKTDQDALTLHNEVDREFIYHHNKSPNTSPEECKRVRDFTEDVQLYKLNFFQAKN
ncbi:fructose-1,6-bisphosphatase class 3 [Acrasis kona]|uniref:Fructose-1,6-bisphosphatase class 3 n=1 Tax=Acrasis kona TaxID=1008807 RepID=A0AAW2Z2T6_9EUKA